MTGKNQINIRKLISQDDAEASVVGEVRQVVYTIAHEVDKKEGAKQGRIANIRVLLMSSAPQLFDEILRWDYNQQHDLISALLDELPQDGAMKELVGEGNKTGYTFRVASIYDDIDVCIHIAR